MAVYDIASYMVWGIIIFVCFLVGELSFEICLLLLIFIGMVRIISCLTDIDKKLEVKKK